MVMHSCDRVGLDFIDTAPFRFVSTVDLAITPEQLFEVLADAESWPQWATVITKVTWTSPEPRGIGTTRTVHMRVGIGDHRVAGRLDDAGEAALGVVDRPIVSAGPADLPALPALCGEVQPRPLHAPAHRR